MRTQTGVVKWFNAQKGYGFIATDQGGGDIFVHHSVIDMPGFKALSEGQAVAFVAQETARGLQATYVNPVVAE